MHACIGHTRRTRVSAVCARDRNKAAVGLRSSG